VTQAEAARKRKKAPPERGPRGADPVGPGPDGAWRARRRLRPDVCAPAARARESERARALPPLPPAGGCPRAVGHPTPGGPHAGAGAGSGAP